ncbi:MAG: Spx/MgsR family RNA polymerase-binding regulatory protein [Bacteroidetes bacterium]|nr:Spx/MgsR family RNA polymerase-binding regulatory protein [Bacteroidota bacterium]
MEQIIIYSIPNCDVTRLALAWLKSNHIDFIFHDYKKKGISIEKLTEWCSKTNWQTLLNKRGTTWKKIELSVQQSIIDEPSAIRIMQEHTSLIKRPVIETRKQLFVGFDEQLLTDKLLKA